MLSPLNEVYVFIRLCFSVFVVGFAGCVYNCVSIVDFTSISYLTMRPLTDEETKTFFEKLSK